MELTPTNTSPDLLLLCKNFDWDIKVHKLLSRLHLSFQTLVKFFSSKSNNHNQKHQNAEIQSKEGGLDVKSNCDKIEGGEIKMVMDRVGIPIYYEVESFGVDEFSSLFDDEAPSLEEVKEAFDVFDENKDGFIDVKELQRVLCSLGLQEGSDLEKCRTMISSFDENGDGLIDFSEFVSFMGKCFC